MGDFALIDSYLETFRKSVEWRPDADDVVAEAADHLFVAVERGMAVGLDSTAAQRSSLHRFGEPRLVSGAFASTASGGVAVPTQFTKKAGLIGMIGAGLLLLFGVVSIVQQVPLLERNGMTPDEFLPALILTWVASIGAFAAIAILTWGLIERHGGALGNWGKIGIVLAIGAAVVMTSPWMIGVGSMVGGLSALIMGLAMLREGMAPRLGTTLYAVGLGLAVAVALVLDQTGWGTVDYWGDSVLSYIGLWVTIGVIYVPGVFLLGRWLHGETAVEKSETPLAVS